MSHELTPQIAIPAVYMRGGTSRAIIFHAADLPVDPAARDAIILAAIGSPDPNRRQLDGLGGAISSLSKIAIVGPSSRPDADVDYTFGQVAIDAPLVGYKGNCGNISSAIGPFALDEGLVAADGDSATVRIHNTNTGKVIVARFPVSGGRAAVEGDFELQGVAGKGAPIRMSFLEPGGAATGRLLPTGRAQDELAVEGIGTVTVSLVDAANPAVFVDARSLGMTGLELPDEIEARPGLLAKLEAIRVAAAVAMGIAATEEEARTRIRNLPLVGILAAPVDAPTLSGKTLPASSFHILARMISAGQPHKASPLTGAMCLAIAMRLPGTIAAELAHLPSDPDADLVVAHPSGLLPVAARLSREGEPHADEAVVYRTARRLMQGSVLVPRRVLESAENVSTKI
ncbi:PrpF family protein [Ancylobacter sonchi]|uniref:2-methylaconitate cis-trans isomerase PrpF family protein n=1 Tax=Ancylobacter sonchi TaxID=1937790 RepID=UPI001BD5BC0E|nr:PrpF domain-containing protein [Ancylobacter sonchi]MBS7534705.1 PrpF family protein [Ancylobacter sonchi]